VKKKRERSRREKGNIERAKKTLKEAKRQQTVKTARDEKRKQNKKPCLLDSSGKRLELLSKHII
jgi:hypothetical protein